MAPSTNQPHHPIRSPWKSPRRWTAIALLSAASTLATAWVVPNLGAWFSDLADSPPTSTQWLQGTALRTVLYHGTARWCLQWASVYVHEYGGVPPVRLDPAPALPAWVALPSIEQFKTYEVVTSIAVGWPFRALTMQAWSPIPTMATTAGPAPPELRGGFDIQLSITRPRLCFPLTPLWPGLTADLVIHSAFWAGLFAGAGWRRRHRRIRRGLCPRCAYDRKGLPPSSPCPECAAPAPIAVSLPAD